MNWTREGRLDRFRYIRVKWPEMTEVEQVEGIATATITENALTTLKVSGTLSYINPIDIGDDLLRIYSDSELDEEKETICHGTFFITTPDSNWSGVTRSGTADMYSTLWILQQNKITETYTVPMNAEAVTLAANLAKGFGNNLNVVATASSKTVNTDHTWDAGTTYLEIINWLLDFAGYSSADVDAYGNIIMAPYVEPADKAASITFSDTQDTVSESSFSHEFDTFEVPNKVVCICSNADNEGMKAEAVNADPENPYSTVARNKLIVRVEQVSDIANQAALEAKAKELLLSSMSVVESIEISHAYQPFNVGDAIQMDYSKAGYIKKLVTVSREKQMVPGIRCKTKARRFVNLFLEG